MDEAYVKHLEETTGEKCFRSHSPESTTIEVVVKCDTRQGGATTMSYVIAQALADRGYKDVEVEVFGASTPYPQAFESDSPHARVKVKVVTESCGKRLPEDFSRCVKINPQGAQP